MRLPHKAIIVVRQHLRSRRISTPMGPEVRMPARRPTICVINRDRSRCRQQTRFAISEGGLWIGSQAEVERVPAGFDEEVRCCKRESCFEQIHYSVKHGYETVTTANVPATFHRVTAQPAIIGCASLPALQALSASHLGDARTAAKERYDAHSTSRGFLRSGQGDVESGTLGRIRRGPNLSPMRFND